MLKDSQNFINNRVLVRRILDQADISDDALVIEIGGGKGIITEELAKKYHKVVVVEADPALCVSLREKFCDADNVEVRNEDFLKYRMPGDRFSIISNIPFNITADIIRKITDNGSQLERAYLIIQKEAAHKFIQQKGSENSLLSNILHIYYNIERIFDIPRGNFTPIPRFDALLILFEKRREAVFADCQQEKTFKDFLCFLYGCSRPIISEALSALVSKKVANRILCEKKIASETRVKQMQFYQWLEIFDTVHRLYPALLRKLTGCYAQMLKNQSKLQKNHRTRKY